VGDSALFSEADGSGQQEWVELLATDHSVKPQGLLLAVPVGGGQRELADGVFNTQKGG